MEPSEDSIAFGKKLAELRAQKDLSQAEVGKMLGIGQSTYAGYETGKRNATVSTINMFSKFYDVSPDYLLGIDVRANAPLPDEPLVVQPPHYADLHPEYRAIVDATSESIYQLQLSKEQSVSMLDITPDNVLPFRLSDQPASAGHGFDLGPENFHNIYVQKGCLPHNAKFGVPVAGNSMEPKYHDGDILVVDGQPVDEGEIGVFTLNGDGYVKKLQCGKLVSLNPDYEPIELHEYDQFKHNGRVIGVLDPECIVER